MSLSKINHVADNEMPAAKRFKAYDNQSEESCHEKNNHSDVSADGKIKLRFGNEDIAVVTMVDDDGQLWMLANPFARILEYSNAPKAISTFVSDKNQLCFENLKSSQSRQTCMTSSLHPKTKFINKAGLFELIQNSKMPQAQEFKQWINSDLLPTLCQQREYSPHKNYQNMSLTKINFVDDKEVETYTIDVDGEKWMTANPFAKALNYSLPHIAISKFVTNENQKTYEEINPIRFTSTDDSSVLPRNIQAKTKFINQAGVFELINASTMPAAKRFKAWNTNDLLPTLCQQGEYSMTADAPVEIQEGMNAVHAATNEGREAPWMEDLHKLRNSVVQKDKIIEVISYENKELSVSLRTSNEKLQDANDKLMYFASALVDSNNGLMKANERIENLANRMADIAQDVIAKPSDPQLLHSLAVCALGEGQYAFVRPQKRSLKRSLDRLSIDESQILFKSNYVPNAMNVLNKVKESLPKDKFTARHNKITLLEDLTREDLVEAINSSMTERQVAIFANKASGRK
ncbi:BRO-A protein [Chrysodeixis chalcites SNPV TF1-A]|uniref:BRO-A n=1 Tax=Chrysodeixis chalcites nucleopolyhedrovirus TaxID=320432 RepID=T1QZX4_9ABAC|nr:BRO-A protein [Chrysodeixis chalcites SNPV TF1-A]AGE61465.1 BRO-A [Chrysodeixis chalcites nucleopolyhedrovirus]AGE61615.1 BRO-A [Chrysodeixis chalcites nucleopolyhedrovirus]